MATKNQPVKEVRLGRIKAVIWKNPGSNGNGPLLNTTLARLYKEPESDNWKESQSLGRHVFYNNSAFGGNDPATGPDDDAAVALDKQALLPGQTATFDNYTSYVLGINGIMIDLAGLPER